MHGVIPKEFTSSVPLPFNFQKSEQMVWAVRGCEYLEDKTHREYVGRGGGFSVRIAKGIYYHTSSFKGHPVDRTEQIHVDTGWFAITNKNYILPAIIRVHESHFRRLCPSNPSPTGLVL